MFNTLSRRYLWEYIHWQNMQPRPPTFTYKSPSRFYVITKKPNPLIIEDLKEDGYNISQVFLSTVKIT